ncbi:MAG: hypothetical protein AUI93_00870 [Crenarchaeota archaeon 13_1_40CM_3_52_10]|nr:MAG: hypothetical protein AUI93_00870 [Crenarchaeota archaeon 13_1_40CM_3_52_10]OLE69629.1 MAG: hypothetical protein AUF78_10375 [archaeon 13_1_20CM_2_51_12]
MERRQVLLGVAVAVLGFFLFALGYRTEQNCSANYFLSNCDSSTQWGVPLEVTGPLEIVGGGLAVIGVGFVLIGILRKNSGSSPQ